MLEKKIWAELQWLLQRLELDANMEISDRNDNVNKNKMVSVPVHLSQ